LKATFTKIRRELEPKWVSFYAREHYPGAEIRLGVPLGPIPDESIRDYGILQAIRRYRPWRPEADLIAILPDQLVLLEAKVFKYMDGLSKLPIYKALIPTTPELRHVAAFPVTMKLLIPVTIPWVIAAAKEIGVEVEVGAPDWIMEVWLERDKYWTKEAVEARSERKRTLEKLGYT
jgi:hypothetical protein